MKINAPDKQSEELLNDVMEDSIDSVCIRGKKEYKISWLRRGTIRKLTKIMLSKGKEDVISCKSAAAIVLNRYWKITLFHWVLWRWFFFVKEYGEAELFPVIELAKKKVQPEKYLINTMFLTEMRDTMMAMTREEADRFRLGLLSAQPTVSGKSTVGS